MKRMSKKEKNTQHSFASYAIKALKMKNNWKNITIRTLTRIKKKKYKKS